MLRLALVAVLAALATGCGGSDSAEPAAPATTGTAQDSPVSGSGLDGEPVSLADFRGKPVFVNVWSSW